MHSSVVPEAVFFLYTGSMEIDKNKRPGQCLFMNYWFIKTLLGEVLLCYEYITSLGNNNYQL